MKYSLATMIVALFAVKSEAQVVMNQRDSSTFDFVHLKVKNLTAGGSHTCALMEDGNATCWGYNGHGQLGYGDTQHRGRSGNRCEMGQLINVGTNKIIELLVAGDYHTCALLKDGNAKCWGENNHGQLGYGDTQDRGDNPHEMGDNLATVDVGPGKTIKELVAGGSHTCARLNDGKTKCWGLGSAGQLGYGDKNSRGDEPGEMGDKLPNIDLGKCYGKISSIIQIAAGGYHTCALLEDGNAKCWGHGYYGQLGYGDKNSRGDEPGEMGDQLLPIILGKYTTERKLDGSCTTEGKHDDTSSIEAVELVAGYYHTCARRNETDTKQPVVVKCWGRKGGSEGATNWGDGFGEMGDNLPNIDKAENSVQLVAGGLHTCARFENNPITCWGNNENGQLGDVPHITAVTAIAAGNEHTCVLLSSGKTKTEIKCWGNGYYGQVGYTGSHSVCCNANEYFNSTTGLCQMCRAGTLSGVVDDSIQKLGSASCVAILCAENERVQNNTCAACPAGSVRAAGDNATSANTQCACSDGYSGDGTPCTACGANEESFTHADGSKTCICSEGSTFNGFTIIKEAGACVACTANANALSGPKTAMCVVNPDALLDGACPVDCKSKTASNNNCILPFEDSVSTPCCELLVPQQCRCNENFHVLNNECVACTTDELRQSGDDPANGNTYCNTEGITFAFGI